MFVRLGTRCSPHSSVALTVATDHYPARVDGLLFVGAVLFGVGDWVYGSAVAASPAIFFFATVASSLYSFI
jgi:hypothetical protein